MTRRRLLPAIVAALVTAASIGRAGPEGVDEAPDEPRLARAHIEYGFRLAEAGRRSDAAREYTRALEIRESLYGTEHIATAEAMVLLAEARVAVGDTEQALDLALRAQGSASRTFGRLATGLTPAEVVRYATVRELAEGIALDVLTSLEGDRRTSVAERVWHQYVPARAAVLDAAIFENRIATRGFSSELEEKVDALVAVQQEIAALLASGESGESFREQMDALSVRRARLESALAEARPEFAAMLSARLLGLSEVAAALPIETSLIAYFRYLSGGLTSGRSETRYLAIVLPDRMGEPVVVPLGSASAIDRTIREWKQEAGSPTPSDPEQTRLAEQAYRGAGEALRRALWDPIADTVSLGKRVFIVPDGSIRVVAFGALPVTSTRYLVETGPVLHTLSAERDVVRYVRPAARGKGMLAVGGVDYDAEVRRQASEAPEDDRWTPACDALVSLRFSPVAGSEEQATAAVSVWTTRFPDDQGRATELLTAEKAGEIAVRRQALGRVMVHLDTRGFFVQDLCVSSPPEQPGVAALLAQRAEVEARRLAVDPLVLGGIALAGANDRAPDAAFSTIDDGLLTTREIAALDLRGTDWVVLSATDTGPGEPGAAAGVLALQRAVLATGARTLVMTQWVGDGATATALVERLYRYRLAGSSTPEALRAASIETIETLRETGASTHPYFWGAFVAAGDWR